MANLHFHKNAFSPQRTWYILTDEICISLFGLFASEELYYFKHFLQPQKSNDRYQFQIYINTFSWTDEIVPFTNLNK
jgi:hypothetical protein